MNRKRGKRPADRHARRLAALRPSTYIRPIDTIMPGNKVRLWCRVSSGAQDASGNNTDQEADMRAAVEARGGSVVDVDAYAGRISDADASLYEVANRADREGSVLLAECTSRFARHADYHPKHRPHLVAGASALRNLRWICGEVPLVTLLDPDATWKEERSHQSKRGQRRKKRRGGRPHRPKPG